MNFCHSLVSLKWNNCCELFIESDQKVPWDEERRFPRVCAHISTHEMRLSLWWTIYKKKMMHRQKKKSYFNRRIKLKDKHKMLQQIVNMNISRWWIIDNWWNCLCGSVIIWTKKNNNKCFKATNEIQKNRTQCHYLNQKLKIKISKMICDWVTKNGQNEIP